MTIGKVHKTTRYERIRIRDPRRFAEFRIKDIGRKGYSKIIVGRLRNTRRWVTQAVLISRVESQSTKVKLRAKAKNKIRLARRDRRKYYSKPMNGGLRRR